MNWLMLLVVFVLALNVYIGYREGFLKVVLSLVAWIAIVMMSIAGTPYVSSWICQNTKIDDMIQTKILEVKPVQGQIIDLTDMYNQIAGSISEVIVKGIAFAAIFVVGVVVYLLLRRVLGFANKLPLIGGLNKSAGGALGFIKGCVIVWVVFAVAALNGSTEWGQQICSYIQQSKFLMAFYENNIILTALLSVL